MVLYWHMKRPQCISWPDCVEAPGCHLTICGGFRCIGKGLVNAYSFMVRLKSIFFSLVNKRESECLLDHLIMVSNWSVHRFSLPTVVFPWSRCVHNIYAALTYFLRSLMTIFFPQASQLLTFPFDLAVVVCKILCGLHVLFCHTATLSQMWRM